MVNLLQVGIIVPASFNKFKVITLVNKSFSLKYCSKEKDTITSTHKIIIAEKKEHIKWDNVIFY